MKKSFFSKKFEKWAKSIWKCATVLYEYLPKKRIFLHQTRLLNDSKLTAYTFFGFDSHVLDPLDLGHIVSVSNVRVNHLEALAANGAQNGAAVPRELMTLYVKHAPVLGVVIRRQLAIHAHAEALGFVLHDASKHELVPRLVDVQSDRRERHRQCAHKNGYLVLAARYLPQIVLVLFLTLGELGRVERLYQCVEKLCHKATPLGQILDRISQD